LEEANLDFEHCRENLNLLIDRDRLGGGDRNEATTRLHLVDELLFCCLGWDKRDCVSEQSQNGQFADYTLGKPYKYAIWEAKREGIGFTLPLGLTSGIVRLSSVMGTGGGIDAAIRQVLEYCQHRSVGIAVVCNGKQLVAFLANRQDNVPPLEGKALVFTSLEEMCLKFRLLWDNLSLPGAEARRLHKALQSETIQPPPDKLALRISGYPVFKNRNPFQNNLKMLAELFIEDLANIPVNEEAFLRACYSASGALSQYALVGKNVLQAKYSTAQQRELKIDTMRPVAGHKSNLADEFSADLLAKGLRRRPIVLLGEVGVGKTIFLRHLLKVEAKKELERAAIFYIDFLKEPALASDLRHYILRRCKEILYSELQIDTMSDNFVRGVYHGELERFSRSVYAPLRESDPILYKQKEIELLESKIADEASHLQVCIEHLSKGEDRLVVVCLDNIDQRPFEFQEQVFQIGHSLAETWPCNVFISLRPDTFYHSRTKGALAAYQPRVFTVSPPRIDEVIIKRLQYALHQLEKTGKMTNSPVWLSVNSLSLLKYLRVLIESFEKSHDLMESIDNMSGGNVREALRFVIAFVGSGHVNAEKIIEKHEAERKQSDGKGNKEGLGRQAGYVIPLHEFLRAVIYGDYAQYDPTSSPVCNVLDISSGDAREHFLLANILAFVERSGGAAEGFVSARSIFDFAQQLGFLPGQIHFALDRAADKRLIEKSARYASESEIVDFRMTTVGAYTISKLLKWFVYLDAVVVDTPIVDEATRSAILNVEHVDQRVERAKIFHSYLDRQSVKLAGDSTAFDWNSTSRELIRNIEITDRAVKASFARSKAARPFWRRF
jgi:hypothetical protein